MSSTQPPSKLLLRPAPFVQRGFSTPRLMLDVIVALLPLVLSALWFFGLGALLLIMVTTACALAMEWGFGSRRSLLDGSALLTGLVLALTLPPTLPLWMACVGAVAAMGLGKLVWGGLGQNLFNPALVGRAFLQAAFPGAMTTWTAAGSPSSFFQLRGALLSPPLMHSAATGVANGAVDFVTTASPLARMKFEHQATHWLSLLVGNVAGSLGETSAALILLGGAYLIARRAVDWRIPASILLTVAAMTGVLYVTSPASYPTPWFMLLSGGLMFGAMFMATDPVTSPMAPRGIWIFGGGIGVLVVLIRLFGGLPEGVMYAILLMNAATPLIERVAQPRPFGRGNRHAS